MAGASLLQLLDLLGEGHLRDQGAHAPIRPVGDPDGHACGVEPHGLPWRGIGLLGKAGGGGQRATTRAEEGEHRGQSKTRANVQRSSVASTLYQHSTPQHDVDLRNACEVGYWVLEERSSSVKHMRHIAGNFRGSKTTDVARLVRRAGSRACLLALGRVRRLGHAKRRFGSGRQQRRRGKQRYRHAHRGNHGRWWQRAARAPLSFNPTSRGFGLNAVTAKASHPGSRARSRRGNGALGRRRFRHASRHGRRPVGLRRAGTWHALRVRDPRARGGGEATLYSGSVVTQRPRAMRSPSRSSRTATSARTRLHEPRRSGHAQHGERRRWTRPHRISSCTWATCSTSTNSASTIRRPISSITRAAYLNYRTLLGDTLGTRRALRHHRQLGGRKRQLHRRRDRALHGTDACSTVPVPSPRPTPNPAAPTRTTTPSPGAMPCSSCSTS